MPATYSTIDYTTPSISGHDPCTRALQPQTCATLRPSSLLVPQSPSPPEPQLSPRHSSLPQNQSSFFADPTLPFALPLLECRKLLAPLGGGGPAGGLPLACCCANTLPLGAAAEPGVGVGGKCAYKLGVLGAEGKPAPASDGL